MAASSSSHTGGSYAHLERRIDAVNARVDHVSARVDNVVDRGVDRRAPSHAFNAADHDRDTVVQCDDECPNGGYESTSNRDDDYVPDGYDNYPTGGFDDHHTADEDNDSVLDCRDYVPHVPPPPPLPPKREPKRAVKSESKKSSVMRALRGVARTLVDQLDGDDEDDEQCTREYDCDHERLLDECVHTTCMAGQCRYERLDTPQCQRRGRGGGRK